MAFVPFKTPSSRKRPAPACPAFCDNVEDEENGREGDVPTGGVSGGCSGRVVFFLEDPTTKLRRLTRLGVRYAEDGCFRQAIGAFTEALVVFPSEGVLWEMRAQAHVQLGETFEAVQVRVALSCLRLRCVCYYQIIKRFNLLSELYPREETGCAQSWTCCFVSHGLCR